MNTLVANFAAGSPGVPYNFQAPSAAVFDPADEDSASEDVYERVDQIDRSSAINVGQHDERQAQLRRKFTSTFMGQPVVINGPTSSNEQQPQDTHVDIPIDPPKQPIHLIWQDLRYGIQVEDHDGKKRRCQLRTPMKRRELLCGVTGEARPGELTVILGPSGCGKTTLMNILSGRTRFNKKAGDGGGIFVNGEKRNKRFKRHTAFVLQEDLFFSSLTVNQTLDLTGLLRIEADTEEEKLQRVQNMIALLNIQKCANSKVGSAIRRGLSGGEKKRLNVANELLVDPALIFLDEPTSGLDAVLADELLNILALLAKSGRTVVTTLHQPSSQIYAMVDKLFLMAEGGRVAYYGPANQAVAYFSKLNYHCPPYYNPADFLLELVQNNPDITERHQNRQLLTLGDSGSYHPTAPTADDDEDSPTTTERSQTSKDQLVRGGGGKPPLNLAPIPVSGAKWPISWYRQAYLLGIRAFRQHTEVAIWNVFIFLIIAIIGSIVWWQRDHSFTSIFDRQGLMFFVLLQWYVFPMFGEVNSLVPEIPIITKERREGMYRLSAYATGKTLAEVLLDVISPFLFTTIIYWSTNLNSEFYRYVTAVVIIFFTYLIGQAQGFVLAAWIGSVELVSPLLLVLMFISMLVSGFYASIDGIPSFFRWLQYINPLRYLFDALIINEFADNTVFTDADTNDTTTGFEIVDNYQPLIWNGSWVCVWYNALIVVGIAMILRFIGFILLKRKTATAF